MLLLHTMILVFSILGGFFFSGTETGFVSWNPLKIAHHAGQGSIVARWALYLMNHKDRLLSAILIGNNICIVAGTVSFLFLYKLLDSYLAIDLSIIPSPESWFLTPIVVLFGEMLPKSLFRIYPFRLTMKLVPALLLIYIVAFPITWFFSLVASIFHRNSQSSHSFMTKLREEMVLIAVEGSKRGTLFESANVFIENTLHLKDRTVAEIMIPLESYGHSQHILKGSSTVAEARKCAAGNDDLVVFNENGTEPVGYVSILDLASADRNLQLKKMLRVLPVLESQQTLLMSLQHVDERSPKFFLVTDTVSKPVGVLDRFELFRSAFGRISPDFNPQLA